MRLTACILPPSSCSISATGDRYFVSEVAEQIGWLASALRSSRQGLVACFPHVQDFNLRIKSKGMSTKAIEGSCSMSFEFEKPFETLNTSRWLSWNAGFSSEVLVRGYPIRPELQISFENSEENFNTQEKSYSLVQKTAAEIGVPTSSDESEKHLRKRSAYKHSIWAICISKGLSWFRRMTRPRLKTAYRRIEWKCVSSYFSPMPLHDRIGQGS